MARYGSPVAESYVMRVEERGKRSLPQGTCAIERWSAVAPRLPQQREDAHSQAQQDPQQVAIVSASPETLDGLRELSLARSLHSGGAWRVGT